MRDNYVGDEGDYAKFAWLREVGEQMEGLLGVNWYRTTHAEGNGDGGRRRHLADTVGWRALDPPLLERLCDAVANVAVEDLSVALIENGVVLPEGTLFHSNALVGPQIPRNERKHARAAWHQAALDRLVGARTVFLDPDNGFEIPSRGPLSQERCKYALDREVGDYLDRGQSVICYQHRPRGKTWARVVAELTPRLASVCAPAPVVVQFGERAFFLLAPTEPEREELLEAALALEQRINAAGWTKLPIIVHDPAHTAAVPVQPTRTQPTPTAVEASPRQPTLIAHALKDIEEVAIDCARAGGDAHGPLARALRDEAVPTAPKRQTATRLHL